MEREFEENCYYHIECKCGCGYWYIVKAIRVSLFEQFVATILIKSSNNQLLEKTRLDFRFEDIKSFKKLLKEDVWLEIL